MNDIEFLTTKEVLKKLRIGELNLRQLCRSGDFPLPEVLNKRKYRWNSAIINDYINNPSKYKKNK